MRLTLLLATAVTLWPASWISAQPQVLDARLHHLRSGEGREWSDFPEKPEASQLEIKFKAKKNTAEHCLRLRLQDIKQTWQVKLNGKPLGRLPRDENDMAVYLPVAAGALISGENVLIVGTGSRRSKVGDDVRIGEVVLYPQPVDQVLGESQVDVEVRDADSGQNLPARLTIVDAKGTLQSPGAKSNDHLAIRPGTIYSSTGKARFGLPAGKYRIYAGRGFEYSLASVDIELKTGQSLRQVMSIRREVPTPGYAACDTHVHTLTHSGHGDATVGERMITLAAEGIELPIATDHNVHIDHDPFARKMNVRKYFTPVIGNEVTTKVGHFNVFPIQAGAKVPNYRLTEWKPIFEEIYRTPQVKAVILNHARDLHGGTRPFGPKLHNALVGENLEGWNLRANAMEVLNSSATQTDIMQLFHDWMGLLNRGRMITPVGSSDSHDVSRHFVGQGRTYIRCNDHDPGNIDVEEAVNNFVQGRVLVSYGLLTEIEVDGRYGPGELAPAPEEKVKVAVRVLAPHWIKATRVDLYANGRLIREARIDVGKTGKIGVKWSGSWLLNRPAHDVHLVAIARGPGVDKPYWMAAKPYQPTSPVWQPQMIGASGAVWIDADGDGRKTAARDYAVRLVAACGGDAGKLLESLGQYDEAVAAQSAYLYQRSGKSLRTSDFQALLKKAAPATQTGMRRYLEAWRKCQIARVGP